MLLSTKLAQIRTQIVTVLKLHNSHGLQHDLTQREDKTHQNSMICGGTYLVQADEGDHGGLRHLVSKPSSKPQGAGILRELSKRLHCEQASKHPTKCHSKSHKSSFMLLRKLSGNLHREVSKCLKEYSKAAPYLHSELKPKHQVPHIYMLEVRAGLVGWGRRRTCETERYELPNLMIMYGFSKFKA